MRIALEKLLDARYKEKHKDELDKDSDSLKNKAIDSKNKLDSAKNELEYRALDRKKYIIITKIFEYLNSYSVALIGVLLRQIQLKLLWLMIFCIFWDVNIRRPHQL